LGVTGYAGPETYRYDANGNRTTQTLAYGYDPAGRPLNDGRTWFGYDGRGRLVQAQNGQAFALYRIDGLGQRVAKALGSPLDLAGDANRDGTFTIADGRLIILMTQGTKPVGLSADCDHDGQVTTADVSCVQNRITDLRTHPEHYVQQTTTFVYDEAGHLLGEYDASGAPLRERGTTTIPSFSGHKVVPQLSALSQKIDR
jgi:uncharacterized protein RhaS with RHS repeats